MPRRCGPSRPRRSTSGLPGSRTSCAAGEGGIVRWLLIAAEHRQRDPLSSPVASLVCAPVLARQHSMLEPGRTFDGCEGIQQGGNPLLVGVREVGLQTTEIVKVRLNNPVEMVR